ncbi:MAG TPA: phosphatase PAP2 family protein [Rhizomicrobium sp.]|jgi:acid phosphatase (class A)
MHRIVQASLVALIVAVFAPAYGDAGNKPYLAPGDEPNAKSFLRAFPAPDSGTGQDEKAIYEHMRGFEHSANKEESDRWQTAIKDNDLSTAAMLADFSCAIGAQLTPENAPHLAAIYNRGQIDAGLVSRDSKNAFARPRPFVGNTEDTCVDRSTVGASFSYPSGHTILSWFFALVLSENAPDRSTAILARGRAFGESRVVCGMHWPSDIEAGRTTASAVFAALESNADFRADMDAARSEIAAARAHPVAPDAARCTLESAASAKQPW